MFYWNWKQHIFHASIIGDKTKLKLCWSATVHRTNDNDDRFANTPDSVECLEVDNIFSRDSNSPDDAATFQKSPVLPAEKHIFFHEIFSFGKNNSGSILKAGFSFDCGSSCRVPVILITIKNTSRYNVGATLSNPQLEKKDPLEHTSNRSTLLLLGIKDDVSILSKTNNDRARKLFSLTPLRLFRITNPCDDISHGNYGYLRFVSDYGFLSFKQNENSSPVLKLYFGNDNKVSQTLVQNFECDKEEHSECDCSLMDVFNSYINKMFLIVIKKISVECHTCTAFLFFNLYNSKYEKKKVNIELLFPEEFAQISSSIKLCSAVMTRNPPSVRSVSLVMLSSTNYAIRFSQGHMTHCVALGRSFHIYPNISEQIEMQTINYEWDGVLKTAVHVKDMCLLIDWINAKIKVIQSRHVQMIARLEDESNVRMLLSLVLELSEKKSRPDLDKFSTLITNVCEETEDENEMDISRTRSGISSPSLSKKSSEEEHEDELTKLNEATQNILKNLIFQEKKCQIDLSDLEQSLKCKEAFIEQTSTRFSELKGHASMSSKMKYFDQPPLVPLIDNVDTLRGASSEEKAVMRHWKIEKLWEKKIGNVLVCGVDLIKVSHSDNLDDIHLVLVPINPCRTVIESKSSLLHRLHINPRPTSSSSSAAASTLAEPSSPPPKRWCLTSCQHIDTKTLCTVNSSSLIKLAGFMSTDDIWSCEDVNIQVYLIYSVRDNETSAKMIKHFHGVNCGILTLSQEEKLGESCSLKSQMKRFKEEEEFLTDDDIVALDCIQNSLDIQISSVINPVTSLLHRVKNHPSITYLPRSDQYIYTADHQLQFCRLKWLSQIEKFESVIRLFSRNQSDLLLFIEFLDSISPSDVTFHLHDHSAKETKSRSINFITKCLYDKVNESISNLSNKSESLSVPVTIVPVKDDDVEIIEDDSLSPKFHSSISINKIEPDPRNKINQSETQGTSALVDPTRTNEFESDKVTKQRNERNYFDFDDEFLDNVEIESKSRKGLGAKKGGTRKLMMKKK